MKTIYIVETTDVSSRPHCRIKLASSKTMKFKKDETLYASILTENPQNVLQFIHDIMKEEPYNEFYRTDDPNVLKMNASQATSLIMSYFKLNSDDYILKEIFTTDNGLVREQCSTRSTMNHRTT